MHLHRRIRPIELRSRLSILMRTRRHLIRTNRLNRLLLPRPHLLPQFPRSFTVITRIRRPFLSMTFGDPFQSRDRQERSGPHEATQHATYPATFQK